MRLTLPKGSAPATMKAPAVPSPSTTLLARTRPALKLIVEVAGTPAPAGPKVRKPALGGRTTVTLAETATARVEMPHWPAASKARTAWAAIPGAPNGPAGPRVSTSRQGAIV